MAMIHHPGGDDAVIAGERPGDILRALARVDADLFLLDIDRMAAELDDRHLGRIAGARRRLLEQERDPLPLHRPAEVGPLRQSKDLGESAFRQVGDAQEIAHSRASLVTIVPMPLSVSTSISNACGTRPSMMCADPTPPSTASAQARSFGIIPALTLSWSIRPLSSSDVRRWTRVLSSFGSSSRPGAAVR